MAGISIRHTDFDGDGHADVLIGALGRAVRGHQGAGVAFALYGDGKGGIRRHQTWSQASPGVPGAAEPSDHFGYAFATGDFNGDGYSDAAIGAPGEQVAFKGYDVGGAGAVTLLYGSSAGLTSSGSRTFTQASAGVPSSPSYFEHFGSSLASGDFDGDGLDDLAVGAPADSVTYDGGASDAGSVTIFRGSRSGLDFSQARYVTEASSGVRGNPEEGDEFGVTAVTGDVNGDGRSDLLIGARGDIGPSGSGLVQLFLGGSSGLSTSTRLGFWQASLVPDGGYLGESLALADLDGDGLDDLVVGSRAVAVGGKQGSGAVDVFSSTADLTYTDHTRLSQDSAGVPDASELDDSFGLRLAVANVDGDKFVDLVVSAPLESRGDTYGTGAVQVFKGSASGVNVAGNQYFTQASEGIPGRPEGNDAFGWSLLATDWNGDSREDLFVGAFEDLASVKDAGTVTILNGGASGLTAGSARALDESDLGLAAESGRPVRGHAGGMSFAGATAASFAGAAGRLAWSRSRPRPKRSVSSSGLSLTHMRDVGPLPLRARTPR